MIWGLSRLALLVALVFLPIMVFSPGLYFWVDLLAVIPIMLMGGMCSDDMMVRIIATVTNFAIIIAALCSARALTLKLRFAFDHTKAGGRSAMWELPGPTVWQARLQDLKFHRQTPRTRQHSTARLFLASLDSPLRTA